MPNVQCSCGKRVGVSDALIGKSIRCPQCGNSLAVTAAPAAAKAKVKKEMPQLSISPGMMAMIGFAIVVCAAVVVIKMGPAKAHADWMSIGDKADGDVTDVVSFALQAYLSQMQFYNPNKEHYQPQVDRPIGFVVPWVVMSMPAKVQFSGMTEQGRFSGTYDTHTGEIEADIAYGGRTVAGLLVTAKATGEIHITGRDTNGSPSAEIDGVPLKVVYPPKDTD